MPLSKLPLKCDQIHSFVICYEKNDEILYWDGYSFSPSLWLAKRYKKRSAAKTIIDYPSYGRRFPIETANGFLEKLQIKELQMSIVAFEWENNG